MLIKYYITAVIFLCFFTKKYSQMLVNLINYRIEFFGKRKDFGVR